MKKIILLFFFLPLAISAYSQSPDLLTAKTQAELQNKLDSAMRSFYFITVADAGKILEKSAHLKDSTYKFSSGVLRYAFNYVADYVDSTSKGRLFFTFEQYKDTANAKITYQSIKAENEKTTGISALKEIGEDAFLQKDNLNQPFIVAIKNNKIFKLRVYYLASQTSLDELISAAKKIVSAH